jgi:hypothetical protein
MLQSPYAPLSRSAHLNCLSFFLSTMTPMRPASSRCRVSSPQAARCSSRKYQPLSSWLPALMAPTRASSTSAWGWRACGAWKLVGLPRHAHAPPHAHMPPHKHHLGGAGEVAGGDTGTRRTAGVGARGEQ